jgi:diguanylate cyclase (GGDEF)-like protein
MLSIVTVVVLGAALLWTATQISRSIDLEAQQAERQRLERSIAVAGGPENLDAARLLTLAGLTGLDGPRILVAGAAPHAGEASYTVAERLRLAWMPVQPGQRLFATFAPIRVPLILIIAGCLLGVIFYLNRVAASLEAQRRAAADLAAADSLTGLANRLGFQSILDGRFAAGVEPTTLLYLDLDGFKAVNDRFGHMTGDRLLADTAARLRQQFADALVIARLGGDEFAVLLAGADAGAAMIRAHDARAALSAPHPLGARTLGIGVSIGVSQCPHQAVSARALVALADAALYRAKSGQAGVCHAGTMSDRALEPATAA